MYKPSYVLVLKMFFFLAIENEKVCTSNALQLQFTHFTKNEKIKQRTLRGKKFRLPVMSVIGFMLSVLVE